MNGKKVKGLLKISGYSLNEIALAMSETPQNLQSMLRTSDMKTGVLERIAKAINKNLYFFFDDEMLKSDAPLQSATKTPNKIQSTLIKEDKTFFEHLQQENKELKAEINTLNKQIGRLEGKLESANESMEALKKEIPARPFRAAR